MKHIQLFEQFLNEKLTKKDLKNLADEISLKIPNLPEFKKFKKGKNDEDAIPYSNVYDLPIAPRLSDIGNLESIPAWMNGIKLKKNQESNTTLRTLVNITNKNVEIFRIVYVVSRVAGSLYGDKTKYVSSFQIMIGGSAITEEMPMILPYFANTETRVLTRGETGYEKTAKVFIEHLSSALNSPGFVELIKQYADAVNSN
jgi:transcriptional regulator with GAF, ATPase, and Fis domain